MMSEAQPAANDVERSVVIVGGGPTGLMLAAELALANVDVVVVERRETQALTGPRARGLQARTIEVLDQRGVAERFLAEGKRFGETGFSFIPLPMSALPTRHPYVLALLQAHFERILAEWVSELSVPIERGVKLSGFAQDERGVSVELSDGRVWRARYLVGCDGGRSLVRKRAKIEFLGWDASTSYLIAEVKMTEEPAWGIRRAERGVHASGKSEDGQRVGVVLVEPSVRQGDAPTLDELRELLVAAYGTDFGAHSPSFISRFSDMARQAATYRKGRVLLAGDAAHVHSPSGGQGLNLGVQDAVNLGWKLAQVVHGTSPESLLDTYHAERHPVAARVIKLTLAQTALGRGDARTEALRECMTELLSLPAPQERYAAMMSGLDIHYDLGAGHPLLGRRMPDLEVETRDGPRRVYTFLHAARPVFLCLDASHSFDLSAWSDRVSCIDAKYTGEWRLPVLGRVPAPSAVLIRPDGHVAWVGEGTALGLEEALTRWFGPPRPAAS